MLILKGVIMKKYMFDTNIYNHMLSGSIQIGKLIGKAEFLVTHIQIDELNNTKDEIRKEALKRVLIEINTSETPTDSFVVGVSRIGKARIGGGNIIPTESSSWAISEFDQYEWTASDNLCESIKKKLDKLNKNKLNNIQDALIAETAIKNNITLVTHDSDLFKVATSFKGACVNLFQVLKEIE